VKFFPIIQYGAKWVGACRKRAEVSFPGSEPSGFRRGKRHTRVLADLVVLCYIDLENKRLLEKTSLQGIYVQPIKNGFSRVFKPDLSGAVGSPEL
jgi:hypothetical protein